MPPRSVKRKRRIFGFQRRVWWPKLTPASKSSRIETTGTSVSSSVFVGFGRRRAGGTGRAPAPPPRPGAAGSGAKRLHSSRRHPYPGSSVAVVKSAWDLAVDCVDEALAEGLCPSLERLGRLGQLGTLPSFIAALCEGDDPARLAEDYARERETLGLAPTEVTGELLMLGRILERNGPAEERE